MQVFEQVESGLARACDDTRLPAAVVVGLGSGVFFASYRRPHSTPSHRIAGLHPRTGELARARASLYARDPESAIRAGLRDAALQMDVDRSPLTGVMGMEHLAEDLESWAALADWSACVREAAREITRGRSLYRGYLAEFLEPANAGFREAAGLVTPIMELCGEWESLAQALRDIPEQGREGKLGSTARRLQKLARLEENFWGRVLDLTGPED